MNKFFHLTCRVPSTRIYEVMQFLKTNKVHDLQIGIIVEEEKSQKRKGRPPAKGENLEKQAYYVIADFLQQQNRPVRHNEIQDMLVARGFARSTFNNAMATAVKKRLIVRLSKGLYQSAKHQGAA